MYYALVFYIRYALRPAVLVRLSVNLTRGNETLLYGRMISAPTAGSDVFTIILPHRVGPDALIRPRLGS